MDVSDGNIEKKSAAFLSRGNSVLDMFHRRRRDCRYDDVFSRSAERIRDEWDIAANAAKDAVCGYFFPELDISWDRASIGQRHTESYGVCAVAEKAPVRLSARFYLRHRADALDLYPVLCICANRVRHRHCILLLWIGTISLRLSCVRV